MRPTDKLYNAKVKRVGSGHELGKVEKGLRLAAADVVQRSPLWVAAYRASRRRVPSEPGRHPKLEGRSIPGYHALRTARRGNHVSRFQPAT